MRDRLRYSAGGRLPYLSTLCAPPALSASMLSMMAILGKRVASGGGGFSLEGLGAYSFVNPYWVSEIMLETLVFNVNPHQHQGNTKYHAAPWIRYPFSSPPTTTRGSRLSKASTNSKYLPTLK